MGHTTALPLEVLFFSCSDGTPFVKSNNSFFIDVAGGEFHLMLLKDRMRINYFILHSVTFNPKAI